MEAIKGINVHEYALSVLYKNSTMELFYYDFNVIKRINRHEGSGNWWTQRFHDRTEYLYSQPVELITTSQSLTTIGNYFYDLQVLAVQSTGVKSLSIIVYETLTDSFTKLIEVAVANLYLQDTTQLAWNIIPPVPGSSNYQLVVGRD